MAIIQTAKLERLVDTWETFDGDPIQEKQTFGHVVALSNPFGPDKIIGVGRWGLPLRIFPNIKGMYRATEILYQGEGEWFGIAYDGLPQNRYVVRYNYRTGKPGAMISKAAFMNTGKGAA